MAEGSVPAGSVLDVVVHNLLKEQHTKEAQTDLRKTSMEITPLAQKLVGVLHTEYTRKASKSYGKFDGNEDTSPSQKYLREYFVEKSLTFFAFSLKMMAALQAVAKNVPASTGGHVFFARLKNDGIDYLLVAVINDEQAIALTEAKDLEQVEHLNLKGFRFAGRVDLTAWQAGEERYVSFLKGTGDVADYFKTFLACDTAISNLKDTQRLSDAVRHFAMSVEIDGARLSEEQREQFLRKVDNKCRDMADSGEPLELETFANEVWPRSPSDLLTTLTSPGYSISDGFVPHKRGLGGLVKFRGRGSSWSVEFDRDALTKKQVVFSPEDQSLRLYGLPEDLLKRLQEETADAE